MAKLDFVARSRRWAAMAFERSADLRKDEVRELLGHQVRLRPFTWTENADYDEAWNLLLAARSEVFFDIGCNKGWFALAAALLNPELKLVLADASPDILALAARHLIANGVDSRARFVGGFVSSSVGEVVDFYTWGMAPSGSRHGEHIERTGVRALSVPTTTVDRMTEDLGMVPDLVKIDVEGAEQEVLDGAVEVTRRRSVKFLVEMHATGSMTMEENTAGVLRWCEANQQDAWYLAEHSRLTDPATSAHRGRCHLLLQPAGDDYPADLEQLEQGAPIERVPDLLRSTAG